MQVISFKDTILYKRGVWLSAAALVAAVASPWVVDGSFFNQPVVHLLPLGILTGFWLYFLQKARFLSIADEVADCQDHLLVRRGRTEEMIPFSAISSVDVKTDYRMHRISIELREQRKIGNRLEFWPQANLWGNLFAVRQVALELSDRARKAAGGNVTGA
jgi:hypothetical protein